MRESLNAWIRRPGQFHQLKKLLIYKLLEAGGKYSAKALLHVCLVCMLPLASAVGHCQRQATLPDGLLVDLIQ